MKFKIKTVSMRMIIPYLKKITLSLYIKKHGVLCCRKQHYSTLNNMFNDIEMYR